MLPLALQLSGVAISLLLLTVHVFWTDLFTVDTTTVALVALLLVSPNLGHIRRIRLGDFEAEIGEHEVERVERDVQATQATVETPRTLRRAYAEILSGVDVDPLAALLRLRIAFEESLARLAAASNLDIQASRSAMAAAKVLAENDVIDQDAVEVLARILSISNRAIHGADITVSNARRIIDSGVDLLRTFDARELPTPEDTRVIPTTELDSYRHAVYKVTTLIPIFGQPTRQTYRLTQEQLNFFLDGYGEYAEFIVGIEPIYESDPGTA